MANQLPTYRTKGILRQMPGVGLARMVSGASSSGLTVVTQAGSYPGVPELDSDVSGMFVASMGTMDDGTTPITINTLHGGLVGNEEASWIWSQSISTAIINTGAGLGTLDTDRGWEWPSYVTHVELHDFDDDPTIAQPDCCTLSDGRIYQVYVSNDGSTATVVLRVRSIAGTWAESTLYSDTNSNRDIMLPCLVVMPDDRVICYLLHYINSATEFQIQARVVYPDDLAVEDYEVFCLKETLSTTTYGVPDAGSQLRGAMKPDGSVMLVMSTLLTDYRLLQLGSYDYGHSFTVVSYEAVGQDHVFPDVVYVDGVFVVSYVEQDVVTGVGVTRDFVYTKTLGHWFDSLADTTVAGSHQLSADGGSDSRGFGHALVATPDARLYSVATVVNDAADPTAFYGMIWVSMDLGESWDDSDGDDKPNVGYDAGSIGPTWAYFTTATAQESVATLLNLCATYQGNRVYVGAKWAQDSQSGDNNDAGSFLGFYLGGWSNQQKAFYENLNKPSDSQLSYKYTWFGFIDPEYNGPWTLTTTGGLATPVSTCQYYVDTDDGQTKYWTLDSGEDTGFVSFEFPFQTSSMNECVAGDVGVEVNIDTGSDRYRLGMYFMSGGGGLRLRDRVAASTIATIPITHTTEYTYKVEIHNSKFQLWYRPTNSSDDQVWERAKTPFSGSTYVGYELTAAASTGAFTSITWGHIFGTTTGATGDAVTLWRYFLANFGSNLAVTTAVVGIRKWFTADYITDSTWDDFHNGYPHVSQPVWATDGVCLVSTGGPTYDVDSWVVRPAYQYGIRNIMPEHDPAPLAHWRSTTDGSNVTITWLVGEGSIDAAVAAVVAEFPGNGTMACYAQGCNFKTAAFYGVNSADAEVKICDLIFTRFSGLTYDTRGGTAQVTAGGGNTYVGYGELVGSYIMLSGSTTPRRITMNTEGQLASGTKTATISFEETGAETQGTDADAGNCIYGTSGFFVCHALPATRFKAYKLKITAQDTAEGYFTIGKFMFGPLMVFGRPPSFGFTTEMPQDNTLVNKTQAGHTQSRVYNSAPRVKQLTWQDGIDQSSLDAATPDYIQYAAGSSPVAYFSDTARQLYGMFQQLNGADELCVFCDSVPTADNSGELHPERYIYGRITSSFQESNNLGHEGASEVTQVTNLVIEEEK